MPSAPVRFSPGVEQSMRDEQDAVRLFKERVDQGSDWGLRVQLCCDLETPPVDNSTVEWEAGHTPCRTVATLTVEPQIGWAPMASGVTDDAPFYNVWGGLAAHQPLGIINRARRDTYMRVAEFRGHKDASPIHEPKALAELP